MRGWLYGALALSSLLVVGVPRLVHRHAQAEAERRVAAISLSGRRLAAICDAGSGRFAPEGLSSWQTVGGCGASSATGAGGGLKWVGRNVSGGLFGVQCQASYSPLLSEPDKAEHHFTLSTLISRELGDRWALGVNVPFLYKYLRDPYELDIDLSNGGLGDVAFQLTRRFGDIAATAVTASVIVPTGKWDTTYRMKPIRQHNQLGFGKYGGSLMIDHNIDQGWGLVVVGASGTYRGGENNLSNYRANTGSAYSYAGFYLGRFVPALGVSVTGFTGHDRDQNEDENSALYLVAGSASLEWSNDYVAIIVGGSLPYQYDGVYKFAGGAPKSPWGWGQWTVGLGVALSPF